MHPARYVSVVVSGLFGATGAVVIAAPAPTSTGTAMANVIAPLALTREADLDFGVIAMVPDSPGTVSITPLGGGTRYTGGASGICALACPAPHPARFVVRGEPLRSYRIAVPVTLSIVPAGGSGSAPVLIDSLSIATTGSEPGPSGALSAAGTDSFEVGGTLHLPAGAAEGRYTAQVPVIVSYL